MVIVGDGECGKTCLVTRMSTGNFVDIGYIPTVFETEVVSVNTGKEKVEIVMFDTAGKFICPISLSYFRRLNLKKQTNKDKKNK